MAVCASRTVVNDGLWRSLLRLHVPLLVLRLPGVVDFEAAVELLPAGGQQLDVCETQTGSHRRSREAPPLVRGSGDAPAIFVYVQEVSSEFFLWEP